MDALQRWEARVELAQLLQRLADFVVSVLFVRRDLVPVSLSLTVFILLPLTVRNIDIVL